MRETPASSIALEVFAAAVSRNQNGGFNFITPAAASYWWAYWIMLTCSVVTPQFFWFRKIRTSVGWSFVLSIFVNIGMWFERFVITVTSLHRDALVSSWDYFVPVTEVFYLVGTFGLFFTLFLLFIRFFPVSALSEVKSVMPQANPHWSGYDKKGHHAPAHAAAEGVHS